MKHTHWTALARIALVLVMTGCAPALTETPIPVIVLDSDSSINKRVLASAQVVPAQEARLSFVVPGPIEELTVREGDRVAAGQILASINSPDLEYAVLEAEAAVRAAELEAQYWQLPRGGDRTVERRELAEQNLEIARRALETARAGFAQTKLIAPYAATVISIKVRSGEYVQPGQVVIMLAKLDNLKIKTIDLSELNIASVKIGQPVTVYIEALEEEFAGEVTRISPISDTIGGDVVYPVTITLDEQPVDLLWGMSADVEIHMEQ